MGCTQLYQLEYGRTTCHLTYSNLHGRIQFSRLLYTSEESRNGNVSFGATHEQNYTPKETFPFLDSSEVYRSLENCILACMLGSRCIRPSCCLSWLGYLVTMSTVAAFYLLHVPISNCAVFFLACIYPVISYNKYLTVYVPAHIVRPASSDISLLRMLRHHSC